MLWATFWPLVLGFSMSGLVQSMSSGETFRSSLGTTTPRSVTRATVAGVLSSSCSYAASSMSRALFSRGSSWTNALVFMIASTNLVIELGLVLYFLLGWQFIVGQVAGGLLMVAGLFLLTRYFFSAQRQDALRQRVTLETSGPTSSLSLRQRLRDVRYYREAAKYSVGDLTMLRKELFAGFLVAGFLSVHVPASWWSHVFLGGGHWYDILENVLVAPLLAVVSFVCSVGNIPLAAALWVHGVAFGGVIAFIFADLITLPLLLIYRRFYGPGAALRIFLLFWIVMSSAGFIIDVLFREVHVAAPTRHAGVLHGEFGLGWTLALNGVALVVLSLVWILASRGEAIGARDPVCGMNVNPSSAVATRVRDGSTHYFCSMRCAQRFDSQGSARPDEAPSTDPVCGMNVDTEIRATGTDGLTYYFCSSGCRDAFLNRQRTNGERARIEPGLKPPHE